MAIEETIALCCLYWLNKKKFYFLVSCITRPFLNAAVFPPHLCSISLKQKISSAVKQFYAFCNITFSPCNCVGFILHMAPDWILAVSVLLFRRATCPAGLPSLVVTQCCIWRRCGPRGRGMACHVTPPALLLGSRGPVFFWAKSIFFWKMHLALWQHHRSSLGQLRISPALMTWFPYGKGPWHLNVPVSGHEEHEKAEVCLYLQGLWEICKAKKKKNLPTEKKILSH